MTAFETAVRALALAASLLTAVGCASGDDPEAEAAMPQGQPSRPSGPCNAVTQAFEVPSAFHVAECSVLPEVSKPPAGGDHYGSWAAFQSYDFPIPHGYLLHCMEHGAVVFYYHCPEGCQAEVAEAQAFIDALPEDPVCVGTGALRRVVLTPDPSLDVRWAMSAWGHTLRADCFDPTAFGSFYRAHYGNAPEQLCNPGVPFSQPPCE